MSKPLPQCVQSMGCWCAGHAWGIGWDEPCDTDEKYFAMLGPNDDEEDDYDPNEDPNYDGPPDDPDAWSGGFADNH